jgi:galactonate dehydratase
LRSPAEEGQVRVTRIETHKHWIDWCNWLFVKVETDEGIHGWGEASLHGAVESVETAVHELGAYLVGRDPAGVDAHWHGLYHAWRWRGGPTLMTALGALNVALWDIEGKRLGVPIYRLLGGPYRDRIRAYASHWLVGIRTPEDARAGAAEAVRRGYSAFKWSPFDKVALREGESRAIGRAAEMMAAAREGAGSDMDIMIECGEQLSPRTAILAAQAMLPSRPYWFEEPIPFENARAMAALQRDLPVPIATGERLLSRWEFRELLEVGGCRVIQPDLMHAAGLSEVRRIASLADTFYIPVAPHNPGGPICTLAAIHLAASIPNFLILEQMEDERGIREAICTHPPRVVDGHFALPTEPGIGTDLDLGPLAAPEHQFRPQPIAGSTEPIWR